MRLGRNVHRVMSALSEANKPLSGLELCQRTGKGPGAIYPAVEILEVEHGWINAEWVADDRRPGERKRVYFLAPDGMERYCDAVLETVKRRAARQERSLLERWRRWRAK